MDEAPHRLRRWRLARSTIASTLLLSGLAVALSAVMTRVLTSSFATPETMLPALGVGIAVPGLLAPPIIWTLLYMLRQVDDAQRRQQALSGELADSREELQELRGLLPICASCKNMRDDDGYWHELETFLGRHANVEFSHSICPECVAKLYPDLATEVTARNAARGAARSP